MRLPVKGACEVRHVPATNKDLAGVASHMVPGSPAAPGKLVRDSSVDFVNSVNNVSFLLPKPASSLEASKHGERSEDDADASTRRRDLQNLQSLHGDTV